MHTTEHFFLCPYCGERISMVLDLSIAEQAYIEDCEVCCNPIRIRYATDGEGVTAFEARGIEQ
jgi:transcription elongation factor Elf1